MIQTGLEKFIQQLDKYQHRKVGLIVNQTSITNDLQYSWVRLKEKNFPIKRIFSPEHGLFSTEQDQITVTRQPNINCEIVSLYKDTYDSLIPDEKFLDDLDLVLFDLQDVGARYYTYVSTMVLFMKAIENRDIEMIILDRPNPLDGVNVEGPKLSKGFESFVGILPIPVRHGLTVGELALFYQQLEKIDIKLSVFRLEGWKRTMSFNDTSLPWIPPSPNMPNMETAIVYPGMCLFEALNISEGRGTTTPFLNFGAPFIEPERMLKVLESMNLKGVVFRPMYVKPSFHKFAGEIIGGLYIHVTDRNKFKPFLTGVALAKVIHDLYTKEFEFLTGVYEFNAIHPAFDILTGNSQIREMILNSKSLDEIKATWQKNETDFLTLKKEFHLYDAYTKQHSK